MIRSSEVLSKKIETTVASTLEKMIFMEVSVQEDSPATEAKTPILASLKVLEPFQDKFEVAIDRELAFDIARLLFNTLKEEVTEELARDFTLEILNLLAGSIMGSLISKERHFRLGIPEIEEKIPKNLKAFDHCFSVNGKTLYLKRPASNRFSQFLA